MIFQPKTLKTTWYLTDVNRTILQSLRGLCKIADRSIDNQHNRAAYVERVKECIAICEATRYPSHMLKKLEEIATLVDPIPFYAKVRWFAQIPEFQQRAVADCIAIVQSRNQTFLVND